jgi:urease gamma subunit
MSFADPLSIDIGAGAVSLPRISVGQNQSTYSSADGTLAVTASSVYQRRTRRVLRLDHNKITADPFIDGQFQKVSMSVYTVFDLPVVGFDLTDTKEIYDGFNTMVDAGSGLLITKLLGGES